MLERINKTNDIKKLNIQEKKELCSEIREYLIDTISKTGGHIASNLGVVELTIALESVFNVKKDKIIWDVGHQSYVHKILNGRKEELKNIRQFNGISGFPKTEESDTDCFNTGHSSTSISAGLGMAKARDIQRKKYNVIAVIGDGALTGGEALEALNDLGCSQTKMIIILNDNEMSISKNISGMNKILTRLRSKKTYRRGNSLGRKIISSIPIVGKGLVKFFKKTKKSIKQVFLPGMYFEEIGIKYLGPVDGHSIEDMEHLFEKVKNFTGPVLIHVITKKGKGYLPAEENPAKFHGIGAFNKETGEVLKSSVGYSKIFGNKLCELAKKNKNVVAITAAMRDGVGMSEFASKYPSRFFDVGIAEGHALTFAAGLAKEGMIPFISIYSSFYQRGYDQVIHDICLQNLHVVMCVDRAGLVGNDGETHQGLYDMAFFRLIPNITIMCPKNFLELEQMMDYAYKYNGPIVIRYPRGGDNNSKLSSEKIVLGKSELLNTGDDLTIICAGSTVSKGLELVNELEKDNIKSDLINIRFIKPLDEDTIIQSISKTKNVVVLEDGTIINGLCTSIKELIIDNNLNNIKSKFYAYPDKFIKHGSVDKIEKKYKLDVDSLYKDIKSELFK